MMTRNMRKERLAQDREESSSLDMDNCQAYKTSTNEEMEVSKGNGAKMNKERLNLTDQKKISEGNRRNREAQNTTSAKMGTLKASPGKVGNIRAYMVEKETKLTEVVENTNKNVSENSSRAVGTTIGNSIDSLRVHNKSFEKMRRINKRGGRGYSRSEWIHHHEEIVRRYNNKERERMERINESGSDRANEQKVDQNTDTVGGVFDNMKGADTLTKEQTDKNSKDNGTAMEVDNKRNGEQSDDNEGSYQELSDVEMTDQGTDNETDESDTSSTKIQEVGSTWKAADTVQIKQEKLDEEISQRDFPEELEVSNDSEGNSQSDKETEVQDLVQVEELEGEGPYTTTDEKDEEYYTNDGKRVVDTVDIVEDSFDRATRTREFPDDRDMSIDIEGSPIQVEETGNENMNDTASKDRYLTQESKNKITGNTTYSWAKRKSDLQDHTKQKRQQVEKKYVPG